MEDVLRIGFFFHGSDGWLGGVNYLRNLFYALREHARDEIEPVLVAEPHAELHGLDAFGEVSRSLPTERSIAARSFERRLLGTDKPLADVVQQLRLDAVSHSGTFGWRFVVPAIPWIPDLQHRRLPQNFSRNEWALRTYADAHQLLEGAVTILSSEATQHDVSRFYGPLVARTRVLRFVSQPRTAEALPTPTELRATLGLPERYFFLPNQFWRHKNHDVVIEALRVLAARNVRPTVVMTGKGDDYRAPGFYTALMRRIAEAGLRSQMPHLGLLPFSQVSALMRDALAVVNPSYFEGWSTTVEEARSLGKATILSDIEVHREQAPLGASYFPADEPQALADELERRLEMPNDEDEARALAAAEALPARTKAFARRYVEIVRHTLESRS